LIEAHGTGTAVGDRTEAEALKTVVGSKSGAEPWCALGSVKSMIGHCLPAAGAAGLIKATLALDQKVLPPTLCDRLHPELGLDDSPFYVNAAPRPWIHGAPTPRRAGVNAFGFGGINAHAVLEEYKGPYARATSLAARASELLLLHAPTPEALAERAHGVAADLDGTTPLAVVSARLSNERGAAPARLAVVATDTSDARAKLERAAEQLRATPDKRIWDRRGVYFTPEPLAPDGQMALMFPGEGSQYPYMLAELLRFVPEMRAWFDLVDEAFADHPRGIRPRDVIFPRREPGKDIGDATAMWRMDLGPEAIFAANQAVHALLTALRLPVDAVVGHSTGEYSALFAAGVNRFANDAALAAAMRTLNDLFERLHAKGLVHTGRLVAVAGVDRQEIEAFAAERQNLFLAMDNCPGQMVLAALDDEAAADAERRVGELGGLSATLPFDRPYHTAAFRPFCDELEGFFESLDIGLPAVTVYSCLTAAPMPSDPAMIRRLAVDQWAERVRFRETVERMHADGIRVFVESGPRNNLTAFVNDILRGRPHLAVAVDTESRSGLLQLHHCLAQLAAHHVPFDLTTLLDRDLLRPRRSPYEVTSGIAPDTRAHDQAPKLNMGIQPLTLRKMPDCLINKKDPSPAVHDPSIVFRNGAPSGVPPSSGSSLPAAPPSGSPAGNFHAALGDASDDAVMAAHFGTMYAAIETHRRVLDEYLDSEYADATNSGPLMQGWIPLAEVSEPEDRPSMPMLRNARIERNSSGLVARLRIDLATSRYLEDHTLGRNISIRDPDLQALPVVPLTFSMELLAEAATALVPGVVTAMEEVRASRWIALDYGFVDLEVEATCIGNGPGTRVRAVVREPRSDSGRVSPAIVEGVVIVGNERPMAPEASVLEHAQPRPSTWHFEDIYGRIMFHGPRLRVISDMTIAADDGAEGEFLAPPDHDLFEAMPAPGFAIDAVSLDAEGQLIGVWAAECLDRAFHVFPFRMERLDIFGPPLVPGTRARCQASIDLKANLETRSCIELVDGDGRLLNRITGWWDKRFELPERFFSLRLDPVGETLARALELPLPQGVVAVLIDDLPRDFLEASGEIWMRVLRSLILDRSERAEFAALPSTGGRRVEWLRGRAALKDAVRLLLRQRELRLPPADVPIVSHANGAPGLGPAWDGETFGAEPRVSLSHKNDIAVALAAEACVCGGVGIDIETIAHRSDAFLKSAFRPAERELLTTRSLSPEESATRLWAAREAGGKALGLGLDDLLEHMVINDFDPESGRVDVSRQTTDVAGVGVSQRMAVDTHRLNDDKIIAVAVQQ
jgi:malonyl CoA-acyl carrier protein transacylase/phosphopantetheinyl transferase